MESFIVSFFTLYGPMGFGWLAAGYLAWQGRSRETRYQDVLVHLIEESTKATTELTTWLKTTLE